MELITWIGAVAGAITTSSFIPQVVKTWKTRHTKDISLNMFALFFVGLSLWTLYGVVRVDYPVIIANAVSLVLVTIMIFFKLKHG